MQLDIAKGAKWAIACKDATTAVKHNFSWRVSISGNQK